MHIEHTTCARAGLIGNPSDGYHGKTISVLVPNYAAGVSLSPASSLQICMGETDSDCIEHVNMHSLQQTVQTHGHSEPARLVTAALSMFIKHVEREECKPVDWSQTFRLSVTSNIPRCLGLAGSSAIVISCLRCLAQFFEVAMTQDDLANLALLVETEELGIAAGLQDRVIQVFGGAMYMDFAREHFDADGHGRYERLDPQKLPPLFVAWWPALAEGTDVVHNDLRERFESGDRAVHEVMAQIADLAQQARDLIVSDRGMQIGPLMDANFDLRASICHVHEGNHQFVRIGRGGGAHVKLAGSGGAVIGAYDGDPERLRHLQRAYEELGATLIVPEI